MRVLPLENFYAGPIVSWTNKDGYVTSVTYNPHPEFIEATPKTVEIDNGIMTVSPASNGPKAGDWFVESDYSVDWMSKQEFDRRYKQVLDIKDRIQIGVPK